jgi:hypothetical protein
MGLDHIRNEIEDMRRQIQRQRKEIQTCNDPASARCQRSPAAADAGQG